MEIPEAVIVDASILFSFFRSSSARRGVFKKLFEHNCELRTPDFVLEELSNNKSDIMKFADINEEEFDDIHLELIGDIKIFKREEYKEFLLESNKISPHGKDTKDDPYFALALALNCAIWSDETEFKEQDKVKIFSTKDLIEEFEL